MCISKKLQNSSVLYGLPPIGKSTSDIESLTSYVSRLSSAHNLKVLDLFTKIVYPNLERETSTNVFQPTQSISINNSNIKTKEIVDVLSNLTTIKDLEELTLINFHYFMSSQELRTNKFWCPYCLQEYRNQNKIVYEKLLWNFEVVDICLKHRCKLVNCCPSCKSEQFLLKRKGEVGLCDKCATWLGSENTVAKEKIPDEYFCWQKWVVENIQELLKINTQERIENNIRWIDYGENIKEIIEMSKQKYKLKMNDICSLSNISRKTFYNWVSGKRKASLYSLLKFGYITNATLKNYFSKDFNMGLEIRSLPLLINENPFYSKPDKNERVKLKEELRKIINEYEEISSPILNLLQISRRLGYTRPTTIREKFPEDIKIIKRKQNEYQRELNDIKDKKKHELKAVIIKLLNDGIYPSERKILAEINNPSFFWVSTNRVLLNELCNELGIVRRKWTWKND
ncbi:hypothetical protein PB01_14360 [Psychrobacillus glaciei]|uniref:TniQ domain-containing protein n=1 Tax=Psychrobacillus glaciei TaxID=2283160 RepID=A0A5J6SPC4_9BACI|nr:TniQ family protein [Psychrobacillus glaciei]QFF99910.1 hypothetical protein PB01_14360 [Psychrobacillus glaciei]